MKVRYRPIAQTDPLLPEGAMPLAGGSVWFAQAAVHERGIAPRLVAANELPDAARVRLSRVRAPICGLSLDRPRIMGVLNLTPDSFSDGGRFVGHGDAVSAAHAMAEAGADLIDIGGESTRPGSDPVPVDIELARVLPVVTALAAARPAFVISIDTRKAAVAKAAVAAGARLVNDVSAMTFDPNMPEAVAASGAAICLMHAQGDPKTMQNAPRYDDVLLDVADYLAERVAAAEGAGITRERILLDPGIGFGKTVEHNLELIRGLALLHDLGCAVLVGASRKRFIGAIGEEPETRRRMPGSLAVALEALRQGAQVVRVHDVAETRQATALWRAMANTRLEG